MITSPEVYRALNVPQGFDFESLTETFAMTSVMYLGDDEDGSIERQLHKLVDGLRDDPERFGLDDSRDRNRRVWIKFTLCEDTQCADLTRYSAEKVPELLFPAGVHFSITKPAAEITTDDRGEHWYIELEELPTNSDDDDSDDDDLDDDVVSYESSW